MRALRLLRPEPIMESLLQQSSDSVVLHPDFGSQPIRAAFTGLPEDPDGQVATSIGIMQRYVVEDAGSPEIMSDLAQALATGPTGGLDPVTDIWAWVRGRVRFQEDVDTAGRGSLLQVMPAGTGMADVVEVFIRPRDLSGLIAAGQQGVGDCDDFSMYAAALLRAAGYPVAFVTIAADSRQPDVYSHVFVAADRGDGQVAVDSSHGEFAGWEAPNLGRRAVWPIRSAAESALITAAVVGGIWWAWNKWHKFNKREAV